jgi:hypothetical protein
VRILQRHLAVALLLCVICAIYLSLRDVALPEPSRIHRAIKEAEPLQEASDRGAFRYASLALLVALGVVWLVRRPLAE